MLGVVLSMDFNLLNLYGNMRRYYYQPQFADYEIWKINTLLNITQIAGSRPEFELSLSPKESPNVTSYLHPTKELL